MATFCDDSIGKCVTEKEAMDIAHKTGKLLTVYRDENLCKSSCKKFVSPLVPVPAPETMPRMYIYLIVLAVLAVLVAFYLYRK